MKPSRMIFLGAIAFLAIPLLTSPAHGQFFRSTLLSCPNAVNDLCGPFYVVTLQPEPLTSGFARLILPSTLRVRVVGAELNATYEVLMISSAGGPFDFVGFLNTNGAGDGKVDIALPADTYASGVILMRDSDNNPLTTYPGGTGAEPRIFSGFTVP